MIASETVMKASAHPKDIIFPSNILKIHFLMNDNYWNKKKYILLYLNHNFSLKYLQLVQRAKAAFENSVVKIRDIVRGDQNLFQLFTVLIIGLDDLSSRMELGRAHHKI